MERGAGSEAATESAPTGALGRRARRAVQLDGAGHDRGAEAEGSTAVRLSIEPQNRLGKPNL
jgi:hypothetical protein